MKIAKKDDARQLRRERINRENVIRGIPQGNRRTRIERCAIGAPMEAAARSTRRGSASLGEASY